MRKAAPLNHAERTGSPGAAYSRTTLASAVLAIASIPASASADSPVFAEAGNKDCSDCPEMVVVPAGKFMMGSPADEPGHLPDQAPLHAVTFAKPFAIGRYEVTFDEWDACVATKACEAVSDEGWGRGRRPVLYVNFEMAQGYTRWLTQKTGKTYRLPSEAEWEYAARANTTTPWFWGSDPTKACEYGNVGDESVKAEHPEWPLHACNDGHAKTSPVGSFKPNAFGLHDTVGNVWEWVEDCYNESYEGAPLDGSAWLSGDCVRRVDRGGAWYNKPEAVRSALRYAGDDPKRQNNTLGFRVVRESP